MSDPPNQGSGGSKPEQPSATDLANMLANIRGEQVATREVLDKLASHVRKTSNITDLRNEVFGLRGDWRADLAAVRTDLADLRREHRSDFRWLLGVYLAGLAGTLAAMAHGFHWL